MTGKKKCSFYRIHGKTTSIYFNFPSHTSIASLFSFPHVKNTFVFSSTDQESLCFPSHRSITHLFFLQQVYNTIVFPQVNNTFVFPPTGLKLQRDKHQHVHPPRPTAGLLWWVIIIIISLWVHCRTISSTHLYQLPVYSKPFQRIFLTIIKTMITIIVLLSVSRPSLTRMPFSFSSCLSIMLSCFASTVYSNCILDVFNFGILHNPWCSLPIFSCYTKCSACTHYTSQGRFMAKKAF